MAIMTERQREFALEHALEDMDRAARHAFALLSPVQQRELAGHIRPAPLPADADMPDLPRIRTKVNQRTQAGLRAAGCVVPLEFDAVGGCRWLTPRALLMLDAVDRGTP